MKAEDLHHFGIDLASGTCAKPWVFASEMLGRVSRTFALNIKVLPAFRLRRPVLLAYLFCRMADTIEDCPSMRAEEKGRLLAIFARIFVQDPEQGLRNAVAFSQALPSGWKKSDDNNEFLCAHCVWTVALYFYLPVKVQQPIAACVREMCEGMARFAQRQETQQGQWLTIDNEADLDQYCYYVAGIVGNMLCDLFYTQSPLISEERYRQMKKLAVSFGLALQVVNITKDVAEDREREVCFIPQEWQRQEGFNHPSDLFHPNASRSARSRVMMHMVHKAWRHLQDSMEFTLLLPALEPRIRLFCLWPLLMAAETLVVVGDGNALFEPKTKVKITRDAVKRILRQTTLFCWNSRWLRSRLSKLQASSPN